MRLRVLASMLLPLVVTACTNLEAVRSVSSNLVGASRSWDGVDQEIAASCNRERQFNRQLQDCDAEAAAAKGLESATLALRRYFTALQDAASDQNFTLKGGLDKVSGSVAAIPGVDAGEVAAAGKIVDLLVGLATDAARERALRDLIQNGAPPAKRLVGLLRRLVPPAIDGRLATEQSQMAGTFIILAAAGGGALGDSATMCEGGPRASEYKGAAAGTSFVLATEYCRHAAVIRERQAALANYRQSLDTADKALDELASAKTRLTDKALATKLYHLGQEIADDVSTVRSAFGTGATQ